jgi:hypothetical protein
MPQELGRNLPFQNCQFDARGTLAYIKEWCAHLRLGTDEQVSTSGISRFQELGTFKKPAESMKRRRRLMK